MTNPLLIAIDGGATGSRFAAFSDDGRLLAKTRLAQPASLTLGVSQSWEAILTGIRQLNQQLQLPTDALPSNLAMGLAGTLQNERRKHFLSLIPNTVSVTLITDGKAQLIGAIGNQPGVCLAVGTGSVLHWLKRDGNFGMAGGWGFPIGDQGSGAWLGMRVLQYYLWSRDGHDVTSGMWSSIETIVGSTVSSIQQWSTQAKSTQYAQLAPIVLSAAEQQDSLAIAIVNEAVDLCVQLVELAPQDLPLVIVGSIGELLSPGLSERYPERIQIAQGDALHGLWLYARGGSS